MHINSIEDWVRQLRVSEKVIIVEGKNDKTALQELGIRTIITLEYHPLYKIAEDCGEKYKKCIILTDFDAHGRRLYRKLKTILSHLGLEIDNVFRESLFNISKLQHIEGLKNHLKKVSCKRTYNDLYNMVQDL